MAEDYDMADSQHFTQTSLAAKERQQKIIDEFELRRKMQSVAVPTNPEDVKKALRYIEEPVTLFGEREVRLYQLTNRGRYMLDIAQMERRERLKRIVAEREISLDPIFVELGQEMQVYMAERQKELFFTEGTQELVVARYTIADWSLRRAKERITEAKRRREAGDKGYDDVMEPLKAFASACSEIADCRPVSACQFSPDVNWVITGGWTGLVKIWTVPDCRMEMSIAAHDDRITGVAWHPHSHTTSPDSVSFATAAADRTAKLWNSRGEQLSCLEGHTDRLGRIAFHPMGQHLATASFDTTWRLWDVETGHCLLEQEGHSRSVYSVAFQCDGAIAASGGLDAIGRIWDCRTGRSILTLQGHVKKILGIDFSPNGYCLVTGSDDHTCRIWDLRKKDCVYSIPAHMSLVSHVSWEQRHGTFIVTTGYDNEAKIWSSLDYSLVKSLIGHEGKIMCGDVSTAGPLRIATVGFDRTLKFWSAIRSTEVITLTNIRHGDVEFVAGDFVLVNAGHKRDRFIGRILHIFEKPKSGVFLRLAWLYRPKECPDGQQPYFGQKEVFQSNHLDVIPKDAISDKCCVWSLSEYSGLKCVTETDFFYRFHYSPTTGVYSMDPIQTYCICHMPYNPDLTMVYCDGCHDWYHPECLALCRGHVEEARCKTSPFFLCHYCRAANRQPSKAPTSSRPSRSDFAFSKPFFHPAFAR